MKHQSDPAASQNQTAQSPQPVRNLDMQPDIDRLSRDLLETAPDAMVIISENGEIVLVNSQAETLFGYSREEMLGRVVEMLVPERYRNTHVNHRKGYFAAPRTRLMGAGLLFFALKKNGQEIPVEISLSPLHTERGLLVTSAIRDITERHLAEERIQKQAQDILEMAAVPVVQVWEGVVLVPLIGMLDSQRTQQLMERLLERVSETASPVARACRPLIRRQRSI